MVTIREKTDCLGNTRFQIAVETTPDPLTGKRRRIDKTVYGTREQAEVIAQRMQNDVNSGKLAYRSPTKLKAWMQHWMQTSLSSISPNTFSRYSTLINDHIFPTLGKIPLKNLCAKDIYNWMSDLIDNKEMNPQTVRIIFLCLKQALDAAVHAGKITINPCAGVYLPSHNKTTANNSPYQAVNEMLLAAKKTDIALAIQLQAYFGCSTEELCSLRWSDIDYTKKLLHITPAVTANNNNTCVRSLLFDDAMAKTLEIARSGYVVNKLLMGLAFTDNGLIICQKDGTAYSAKQLAAKRSQLLSVNNLPNIRQSDISYASSAIPA